MSHDPARRKASAAIRRRREYIHVPDEPPTAPGAEACTQRREAADADFQQFLERTSSARPGAVHYSPAAYAALRGLTGPAADMFTEIATAIRHATESSHDA